MAGKRTNTGRALSKRWRVSVKHALYRLDGKWYHLLKKFPGALFDRKGYLVFETLTRFKRSPHLDIKKRVHVRGGISQVPGYVKVLS